MHVSVHRTSVDDAELTHHDPILRGVVRTIGGSSIVPSPRRVAYGSTSRVSEGRGAIPLLQGFIGLYD